MKEASATPTGHGTPTSDDATSPHGGRNVTPPGSRPELLTPDTALHAQHVPGKVEKDRETEDHGEEADTPHEDEEEEFDYLAYAQERAMFFWGDILQLGIAKRKDLPAKLLEKAKIVEY